MKHPVDQLMPTDIWSGWRAPISMVNCFSFFFFFAQTKAATPHFGCLKAWLGLRLRGHGAPSEHLGCTLIAVCVWGVLTNN